VVVGKTENNIYFKFWRNHKQFVENINTYTVYYWYPASITYTQIKIYTILVQLYSADKQISIQHSGTLWCVWRLTAFPIGRWNDSVKSGTSWENLQTINDIVKRTTTLSDRLRLVTAANQLVMHSINRFKFAVVSRPARCLRIPNLTRNMFSMYTSSARPMSPTNYIHGFSLISFLSIISTRNKVSPIISK